MTRAAFALWAGAVLLVYYRRAWWLLAAGAFREWTLADARATVLPLALLVIVAAGSVGWTLNGTARRRAIALIVLAAVLAAGVAAATGPMFGPFAGEAVARGAAAVAGAALVAFVAWTLGTALWEALAGLAAPSWPGNGATRFALAEIFLFQLAVGFGALAAVSGVLALAGWYTPPAVLGVLALSAVVGFGRIWMRRGRFGNEWRERGTDFGPGWKPRGVVDRAWFGVTILALAVALAGALAPETEYDALWYHLWLPRQWLLRGTAFDTSHEYVALYPLTWELVFGAGLAAGGPGAAKLLHFCCLPLLALTAWQATRRFFPAASPWLAAAVTVTVPTVLWEATTAYIDLALALYVSLALYALMAWRDDRAPACFWLAAICLGLGAAVKHLGLVAVVLAAVALTIAPPDDDPVMRRATRRNWGRDWISWRRLLPPAALIATALLIAAPWYLRAWLASGNPIFPELFEVFGATPALRWDAV
ncbi:MAG: hypothetical protein EHM24_22330, partial [Acidobacteria bacterium]